MKQTLFFFLIFGFLLADDALAFRCGSEVVSVGDSVVNLKAGCGTPDYKEFAVEKFKKRWESVQKWFYNCGDNDFIYMLTIIHSKIVAEDIVGRGSGKPRWQK